MSGTRCVDGCLMRHDPVPFDPVTGNCDPYYETDIGECPECEGNGRNCDSCGASHAEERRDAYDQHRRPYQEPICTACADKARDRWLEDHG